MNILGVNATLHGASACLMSDYVLLAAVQEERLSRVKGDGGELPLRSIAECLKVANLTPQDVDAVALGTYSCIPAELCRPGFKNRLPIWCFSERGSVITDRAAQFVGLAHGGELVDPRMLRGALGLKESCLVHFFDHHAAHAAAASFYAGGDSVLTLTADGGGDFRYYSTHYRSRGRGEDFVTPGTPPGVAAASVGLFYAVATEIAGYTSNQHEGKITSLAAFGRGTQFSGFSDLFYVSGTEIRTDRALSEIRALLLRARHALGLEGFAAAVQAVLESTVCSWIDSLIDEYAPGVIALGGGVFSNIALNQRIHKEFETRASAAVFPAMGDEGNCIGGALLVLLARDGLESWSERAHELPHVFLGAQGRPFGPLASECGMTRIADRRDAIGCTLRQLEEGKAVGTYLGRAEFGPRALGARSVLMRADEKQTVQELSRRLSRDAFMPFSPVLASKDALAEGRSSSATRFMTSAQNVHAEWASRLVAASHVDGTVRAQIIDDTVPPLYAAIVREWERTNNQAGLINTSFNLHEEPIIYGAADVQRAVGLGLVDVLVCEDGVFAGPAAGDAPAAAGGLARV